MGENKRGRSTDAERQLFTYSKDTLQDGESSFPLTFFFRVFLRWDVLLE